ncbi:hypothetical protein MRBLWS13_002417 [Microbacterium sp. LWS13-1.2]|uniref:Uncharacterized protein n=1 Tax=Microbacterium sp. LWS13-1.2 TaxID=3135264 RepID=A0AAU6SCX8_9MICO
MALAALVDPPAEGSGGEPLLEPQRHPEGIESVAGDACLDAEVFHRQRCRLVEQQTHRPGPRLGQEVGVQLGIAIDGRLAETRAERVELRLRERARRERIPNESQPLGRRRRRRLLGNFLTRGIRPGCGGFGRRRSGGRELLPRLHRAGDIAAAEAGDLLNQRRPGAQPLALRGSAVSAVAC